MISKEEEELVTKIREIIEKKKGNVKEVHI